MQYWYLEQKSLSGKEESEKCCSEVIWKYIVYSLLFQDNNSQNL